MATQIANYFETLFAGDVKHDYQQKMAKLRALVDDRSVDGGDTLELPNMGTVGMNTKGRDGKLTWLNPDQDRTVLTVDDFYSPIYFDKKDARKMSIDVAKDYMKATVAAAHRKIDDLIISAWETSNTTITTTAGGMSQAKVFEALEVLMEAEADEEDLWGVLSPKAYTDLLADTNNRITSSDFVDTKLLVGVPKTFKWAGVNWMVHSRLPLTGNIRNCYIGVKSSTVFGADDENISSRVDWMPEHHGWLTTTSLTAGAVVRDAAGVIEIDVDESA